MKRIGWKHGLALALAGIMALGVVGVASAKPRARDYLGVWQLDQGQNGWNNHGGYGQQNGQWGGHDGGNGGWGNGNVGRDQNGYGQDAYRQNGNRGQRMFAGLPETFRIDRDHRHLQVESMDGRVLREMNGSGHRQLISQRTFLGQTIIETYSLSDRGNRLVIHTSIQGPRGARDMTSVYERA